MTTYQTGSAARRLGGRLAGADPSGLLRLALNLDAVASGSLGVLSVAAAPVLDDLLGIPSTFVWALGLFLAAYAAVLGIVASRPGISRPAVWAVIVGNLIWAAGSVAAVAADWFSLTGIGIAFVLVQAAAVVLFADLQFAGMRRARAGRH